MRMTYWNTRGRHAAPFLCLLVTALCIGGGCHLVFPYQDQPPDAALPAPDGPAGLDGVKPKPDVSRPKDGVGPQVCGDGVRQGSEQCDFGKANLDIPDSACRTSCLKARCGDKIIDTGEECDGAVEGIKCSSCQLASASLLGFDARMIHFGALGKTCPKVTRTVGVLNPSSVSISVKSAKLVGCPSQVTLDGIPTNHSLPPNSSTTLKVSLSPSQHGVFSCVLALRNSDGDLLLPITGQVASGTTHIDRLVQRSRRMVDLVLLVDNSASMYVHGKKLVSAAPSIRAAALAEKADLHLGVFAMESLSTHKSGALFGSPPYLTHKTPAATFEAEVKKRLNMKSGASGSEQGLLRVKEGFRPPLTSTTRISCAGSCPKWSWCDGKRCRGQNWGFRRPGAHLELIVATNEDDSSSLGGAHYISWFQQQVNPLLGAHFRATTVLPGKSCRGGVDEILTWPIVQRGTGGRVYDLCSASLDGAYKTILKDTLGPQRQFRLTRLAAQTAQAIVAVKVGGKYMASTEYIWHQGANALELKKAPADGAVVEVKYTTRCK